jgi:hypothetical protein
MTDDTLIRRMGVWMEQSVCRPFYEPKTVCGVHGLYEEKQISWLKLRARCPKA